MSMTTHLYTKDFPESNDRTPQPGEHAYAFAFPLEMGDSVVIHCGEETMAKFRKVFGSIAIDDEAERVTE